MLSALTPPSRSSLRVDTNVTHTSPSLNFLASCSVGYAGHFFSGDGLAGTSRMGDRAEIAWTLLSRRAISAKTCNRWLLCTATGAGAGARAAAITVESFK